jgi:hypothetical protein
MIASVQNAPQIAFLAKDLHAVSLVLESPKPSAQQYEIDNFKK